MKTASLVRDSDKVAVVATLWVTQSVWEQTRGLLRRPPLIVGQGMLLQHCRSIHTIGMTYPLDIVFLDKYGIVRKCVASVKPLRFAMCFGASTTLELPPGGLAHSTIRVGDTLRVHDVDGLSNPSHSAAIDDAGNRA
ncbi:MAG: DUF192 domain-containing protein [Pseudomonadota bacterium]